MHRDNYFDEKEKMPICLRVGCVTSPGNTAGGVSRGESGNWVETSRRTVR